MSRIVALIVVLCAACCLIAGSVLADRLILIPTGRTLTTGGIKGEFLQNSDLDAKAYWVNLGVSKLELEGARFQDFGPDDVDVFSAQIQVMPETTFTPEIALGVRDIADESDGSGALYDGQSVYVAATKGIPVTGGIPILFQDVRLHGGIGTGSLSGVFFGIEGTLPMGIRLAAEYDTEDFNVAASYSFIPALRARAAVIKDDFYVGGLFSTAF